jgi:hypothetical protein
MKKRKKKSENKSTLLNKLLILRVEFPKKFRSFRKIDKVNVKSSILNLTYT